MQPHSWIEPHPKFKLVLWASTQANPLKLLLCMFIFKLKMFENCLCFPCTQYSVIQSSNFELNPTYKPITRNKIPGLHSRGYGNQTMPKLHKQCFNTAPSIYFLFLPGKNYKTQYWSQKRNFCKQTDSLSSTLVQCAYSTY